MKVTRDVSRPGKHDSAIDGGRRSQTRSSFGPNARDPLLRLEVGDRVEARVEVLRLIAVVGDEDLADDPEARPRALGLRTRAPRGFQC
jgi:hypothetical protein